MRTKYLSKLVFVGLICCLLWSITSLGSERRLYYSFEDLLELEAVLRELKRLDAAQEPVSIEQAKQRFEDNFKSLNEMIVFCDENPSVRRIDTRYSDPSVVFRSGNNWTNSTSPEERAIIEPNALSLLDKTTAVTVVCERSGLDHGEELLVVDFHLYVTWTASTRLVYFPPSKMRRVYSSHLALIGVI